MQLTNPKTMGLKWFFQRKYDIFKFKVKNFQKAECHKNEMLEVKYQEKIIKGPSTTSQRLGTKWQEKFIRDPSTLYEKDEDSMCNFPW